MNDRQKEKAHAAKRVVRKQQPARVIPIGEPTADQRADKIEHPHDRKPIRRSHFGKSMLGCVGNEMLTNKPIARHATHHECDCEQPKLRSTHRPAKEPTIWRPCWLWGAAIRCESNISRRHASTRPLELPWLRAVRRRFRGPTPTRVRRQRSKERKEHQQPSTRRRTKNAGDKPSTINEPTICNRCAKHARNKSTRKTRSKAKPQVKRPQ